MFRFPKVPSEEGQNVRRSAATSQKAKVKQCPDCSQKNVRKCALWRPNMITKEVADLAEVKVSFKCRDRCGVEKIKFNEVGPHSMWFCRKKPLLNKKDILGRNWLQQKDVEESTADLEAQFAAMDKQLDKKFGSRASEVSVLATVKEVLNERLDLHGRKITALELPITRQMALMRQLDAYRMPMLAEDDGPDVYRAFEWTLPREALEQATDTALERGLVTAIEIGTKPNIRSLTSIKLTFDNGHEQYTTPTFGAHDRVRSVPVTKKIEKITACHFGDSTSFVMLNDPEDNLAFGAQRTDTMHQVKQVERRVKHMQTIVGVYGYKVKNDSMDKNLP